MHRVRVVIMGAGGRDFHNYNTFFRSNPGYQVVAFTAAQIPGIEGRVYPPELAGPDYPQGIPIFAEEELGEIIKSMSVERVVFAYSDVSHAYVMHRASQVLALGADFWLLGPEATMLKASVPVVSVCAVRTGAGKSQTTRRVTSALRAAGQRVVVVRHPMAYGDLVAQTCQRLATRDDLDKYHLTIEEREEYEPLLSQGMIVYAGVDYGKILEAAEREADVIVWDGGNNDWPFYRSNLEIVVADPLRAGDEVSYHPGETNLRRAHVVVINKVDSATPEQVEAVRANIQRLSPEAIVVEAASEVSVSDSSAVRRRRVLVVEDGPTLTHGNMSFGAGLIAAERYGAAEIVDPRPYAVGSIREVFARYPNLERVLPAMGYSPEQVRELEQTIDSTPADLVVVATPIDLAAVAQIRKPTVRVRYELRELTKPSLAEILALRLNLRQLNLRQKVEREIP